LASQITISLSRANGTSFSDRGSRRFLRLACLAGGVGLGFSFAPSGFSPLAWIGFVPVFLSVRDADSRTAFIDAWLFHTAWFLTAFWWPVTHMRADTAVVSATAWLAMTLTCAAAFGIPAGRRWLLFLLLERLLESGPVQMPWPSIANSQLGVPLFVRAASVVGAEGLTAGVLAGGVLGAVCVRAGRAAARSSETVHQFVRPAIVAGAGALLVALVIALSGAAASVPPPVGFIRVALLQPGMRADSWSDVHDASRVDTLLAASEDFLDEHERPALLIWPETALPIMTEVRSDTAITASLSEFTDRRGVSLLAGGIMQEGDSVSGRYRNVALLVAKGDAVGLTEKNRLVPFAEYVPFSDRMPLLNDLAVPSGGVAGYAPGRTSAILAVGSTSAGILICFESAFPGYADAVVDAGADLFVVLTQDGWWRGNTARSQHFEMARLRASEQGRAVVQVSVDGYSGLVLPDGTVADRTASLRRETRLYDVPIQHGRTFYARVGRTANVLLAGIWTLLLGLYGVAPSGNRPA
jgi:apolipoprotein N-acyltransferase